MKPTYPALIRNAAAQVLALRHAPTHEAAHALIGRLYGIAEGIERGDPAESIAGDPTQFSVGDPREFMAGDPAQFIAGDPARFAHITHPEVIAALIAGPAGEWTDLQTQAALRTFGAFEADRDDRDNDIPVREESALALHDAYMPDTGDRDRAAGWRALYQFWMDAPAPVEPAPVDPDTQPYRATVKGLVWKGDDAVPVDGARHSFYVSQAEVEGCADRASRIYDELVNAALTPPEVKQWIGPLDIYLERRPFQIEDDRPGAPLRYADDDYAAADLLTRLLKDDRGDLDAEVLTQIEALPDSMERARPDTVWVFAGSNFHLTVSRQPGADD